MDAVPVETTGRPKKIHEEDILEKDILEEYILMKN